MAEYKNVYELFQYWENDAYPDYVCGIWSTNGGVAYLTVAVNTKDAKDEILSLIEDDSSVSFTYQKYSKNYLLSIIDEMNTKFCEYEFAKETGFLAMCLNEYENRVEITIDDEKIENSATVELVTELENRFGEAVYIEYSDADTVVSTEDLVAHLDNTVTYQEIPEKENTALEAHLSVCCVILAISLLVLSCAFILQKRRALRTVNGKTVTSGRVTLKEIEELIKNSPAEPSSKLDEKINNLINK